MIDAVAINFWPERIATILMAYYNIQSENETKELTNLQLKQLTSDLIVAYDALSRTEKGDVLVPAKGEFLNNRALVCEEVADHSYQIDIKYKWPENDGFCGRVYEYALKTGEKYDRLGNPRGAFLSPLYTDGSSVTFFERALPYYIPEKDIRDSPAYHRYSVRKHYCGENDKSVLRGKIAHAFWNDPRDGSCEEVTGRVAEQIVVPVPVQDLINRGVFSEIS